MLLLWEEKARDNWRNVTRNGGGEPAVHADFTILLWCDFYNFPAGKHLGAADDCRGDGINFCHGSASDF